MISIDRPTEKISDELEKCCVCCVKCVFADSALVILHTDTQQRNSRRVKSSAIYSRLHSIHSKHTDFEIHYKIIIRRITFPLKMITTKAITEYIF